MIAVIGLGFVGLTTALGFASKGHDVLGIDASPELLKTLSDGTVPFHEPGLQEALNQHLGVNLSLAEPGDTRLRDCESIFVCVGTPSDEAGRADLGYIRAALEDCRPFLADGVFKTVVIKSTVPPGSTENEIRGFLDQLGLAVGEDVGLANNPEFLREGLAWQDFLHPDRVVLGVSDEKTSALLQDLYKPFDCDVHCVSLNEAEFIKYASNTFLATAISFANEMSMIATEIGDIQIARAFRILHEDGRWSGAPASMKNYLYPGCGFGGYCLPKDTLAMQQKALELSVDAPVLKAVLDVNAAIKPFLIDKLSAQVPAGSTIGVLGLSFKPESDDVRQSPSAEIIRLLLDRGYKVIGHDPIAVDSFASAYKLDIDYEHSLETLCDQVDHLVIATGWKSFLESKSLFEGKNVFDMRYLL